jgi:hypothetical protein
MATTTLKDRNSRNSGAPERQPPQDPTLCIKIDARLARLDYLLKRPSPDLSMIEQGFRALAAIMPAVPARDTVEPGTGLPSNLLLEARMKLDGALRKLVTPHGDGDEGFSVFGFERCQECVQGLKRIFAPQVSPGWSKQLKTPPRSI